MRGEPPFGKYGGLYESQPLAEAAEQFPRPDGSFQASRTSIKCTSANVDPKGHPIIDHKRLDEDRLDEKYMHSSRYRVEGSTWRKLYIANMARSSLHSCGRFGSPKASVRWNWRRDWI